MNDASSAAEVLLAHGDTRSGLAVARSLAHRGITFVLVGSDPSHMAFSSRYVKSALISPSPVSQPEAFLSFVLEAIESHRVRLILPITDAALVNFDRNRNSFPPSVELALAKAEAVRSVLDKRTNLGIAQRLGVPCPKTFELESLAQLPDMIAELGFPIVMKNPGPELETGVSRFDFGIRIARSEADLRELIESHCEQGRFPLFQEWVSGEVVNMCAFAVGGRTLAVHEYVSLRRSVDEGILREIRAADPELEEYTRRILRELEWDGVAHTAFIVNRERGQVGYLETNGRFWASIEGSIHAGWDFPYWVHDYFLHGTEPEVGPVRLGSRTCWRRGDLQALLRYLAGGRSPTTYTEPGKLNAIWQYVSSFRPSVHSDVFRLADPVPALKDHWSLLKHMTRRGLGG